MAKKGRTQKKPYCNPKITKVNLKSEEAVLTACKSGSNYNTPLGTNAEGCKWHGSTCIVTGS